MHGIQVCRRYSTKPNCENKYRYFSSKGMIQHKVNPVNVYCFSLPLLSLCFLHWVFISLPHCQKIQKWRIHGVYTKNHHHHHHQKSTLLKLSKSLPVVRGESGAARTVRARAAAATSGCYPRCGDAEPQLQPQSSPRIWFKTGWCRGARCWQTAFPLGNCAQRRHRNRGTAAVRVGMCRAVARDRINICTELKAPQVVAEMNWSSNREGYNTLVYAKACDTIFKM